MMSNTSIYSDTAIIGGDGMKTLLIILGFAVLGFFVVAVWCPILFLLIEGWEMLIDDMKDRVERWKN